MTFSPALNVIDLNDYLGPSQICIKPTTGSSSEQAPKITQPQTEIRLDEQTQTYYESIDSQHETKLKKAEITLNDCLACSGCITSAESVLVSLQSVDEVLQNIKRSDRYPIISISAHSLASLTAHNGLDSIVTTFNGLRSYFMNRLNFRLVLDLGFSQRLHLFESRREYQERERQNPIIASSCPGWICYAEKTQDKNGVLEMISTVRSAQQIQGALVKSQRMAEELGVSRDQIYHVCVMSCYDKKLEASRVDFQVNETRDVDCVLTTREVQKMMEQDSFDLVVATTEPCLTTVNSLLPIWIGHPEPRGSSSGGYLFNILRSVAQQVPTMERQRLRLVVDRKRGSDYIEYQLIRLEGDQGATTLFHGARFYGFKNLQNLIRRLTKQPSRGRTKNTRKSDRPFDYVEVMACPSGCVNGGGQIIHQERAKEWISKVEALYFRNEKRGEQEISDYLELDGFEMEEEQMLLTCLSSWNESNDLLRTQYRAVEAETNGLAVQW